MTSKFRGKYLQIHPLGQSSSLYHTVLPCLYSQSELFGQSWYLHTPRSPYFTLIFFWFSKWKSVSCFYDALCFLHIVGIAHCKFEKSGNHYTWRKVTTTVHNIIVGKLWVDNHGEMDIVNHKTGDKCHLKFSAYSYFSRDVPRKVSCTNITWCTSVGWFLVTGDLGQWQAIGI